MRVVVAQLSGAVEGPAKTVYVSCRGSVLPTAAAGLASHAPAGQACLPIHLTAPHNTARL